MSLPAIRPRPDQIYELSRGLCLPLQEIESDHLEIIAEGLAQAFNHIQKQSSLTVTTGIESEVTTLMEARLNNLISEDPF